jgi:hypothetical protein|tara:strand:- start:197 stop:703 length:507 start_codon:yes stop_codon:yes gene_type:complete
MIHIIDGVFANHQLEKFSKTINRSTEPFVSGYASKKGEGFFKNNEDHPNAYMCNTMKNYANKFFELQNTKGYEYWTHVNTKPNDTHQDKDEVAYLTKGISRFPQCSTVFYLEVENLKGGELVFTNGITVKPKVNRLVLFSPGLEHFVEEFTGHRVSIAVNPWSTKLYS